MIIENENQFNQPTKAERKRFTNPTPFSGLGKLPPQAIDLEEIVLGALMLERDAFETISSILITDAFYKDSHQKIFNSIKILFEKNSPIDIVTVTAQLRRQGELEMIGGAYYITELTNRVASAANIEYHSRIIQQKFLQRELIRISGEVIQSAYEDTTDVLDLLDTLGDNIGNIKKGIFTNSEKDAKELVAELRAEQSKKRQNGLLGISTGFISLDRIMKGDQEGDVRIIAGSTSMGKTALECSEVLNCCFDSEKNLLPVQTPVAVFNLEMKSVKFSIRLLSNLSSIDKDIISLNEFSPDELIRYEYYLQLFEQSLIFIEDCNELNINQLEVKIASLVKKHGVRKVYIDYVQLMKPDPSKKFGTRELELSDIGRRVKACAKKYKITIVELLQLNDEVLKAKNCMPNLSHLRECKALGHDADNVFLIWRPEYYESVIEQLQQLQIPIFGITLYDFKEMALIIVAKNREGILGKIPIKFKGNIARMYDHPLILDAMKGNIFTTQREATF